MFEQLPEAEEKCLNLIAEKYARIAGNIRLAWGTEEGKAYLDSLITNDRGERAGFPFEVFKALMELQSAYKVRHFSTQFSAKTDTWQNIDK